MPAAVRVCSMATTAETVWPKRVTVAGLPGAPSWTRTVLAGASIDALTPPMVTVRVTRAEVVLSCSSTGRSALNGSTPARSGATVSRAFRLAAMPAATPGWALVTSSTPEVTVTVTKVLEPSPRARVALVSTTATSPAAFLAKPTPPTLSRWPAISMAMLAPVTAMLFGATTVPSVSV